MYPQLIDFKYDISSSSSPSLQNHFKAFSHMFEEVYLYSFEFVIKWIQIFSTPNSHFVFANHPYAQYYPDSTNLKINMSQRKLLKLLLNAM